MNKYIHGFPDSVRPHVPIARVEDLQGNKILQ